MLSERHPEVPPALDAVVMKCLAPDPPDRYASAADLAADLQAVADDGPLRFAREPQPSRTYRWLRRNQRRLAVTTAVLAPVAAALALIASTTIQAKVDRVRLESKVKEHIDSGKRLVEKEDYDSAMFQFDLATQMAERKPGLENLFSLASEQYFKTDETRKIRAEADTLFREADALRFLLLNSKAEREAPTNDFRETKRDVEKALEPFYIFANKDWLDRSELTLLDRRRRERLPEEVNEILFLWGWAFDRWATALHPPDDNELIRGAIKTCDWALQFTAQKEPWQALRAHYAGRLAGELERPGGLADPAAETSARACFQWSLLSDLQGRRDWAIAWLERAVLIEPGNYWYQFYLATNHERAGHFDQAREHFDAAVVANPDSPWARRNRAHLYWSRGSWDRALADLQVAIDKAGKAKFEFTEAHLDLGCVYQAIGDERAARSEYDFVIAKGKGSAYVTAARQNRAKLDYDAGKLPEALGEFDALLAENPDDASARLGRAMLLLRMGQASRAETDLTFLIQQPPSRPESLVAADFRVQALELRALARLTLGQLADAELDAAEAFRLEASPSHERLWARTLLALGHEREIHVEDPDEIALWPLAGPALAADLRAAAARMRLPALGEREVPAAVLLTRAVLLSALNDPAAPAEVSRAVDRAHSSSRALLIRGRVRRRAGDRSGAWKDVEQGLAVEPNEPRLLELRGILQLEDGHPEAALADFDRAIRRGAGGTIHRPRAQALTALGRLTQALDDWTLALTYDPEDPRAFLGRARAFLRLRKFDQALADLEQAASWAGEHTELLVPMTLTYAGCLTKRPNRLPRVLALVRRSWTAAITSAAPRPAAPALSGL
jgi:tetratricopeptide (TPR) repeat protein